MTDFPSLSRSPNRDNFSQMLTVDPTITSEFENGFMLSRSKFENVALKFDFQYSFLTSADKIILEDFEKEVAYRAGSFNWDNPSDDNIYIVRFDNNLIFRQERAQGFWSVDIKLVEIRPNTSNNVS